MTSQGDSSILDVFPLPNVELEASSEQGHNHEVTDGDIDGCTSGDTLHEGGDNQDDTHTEIQGVNGCETTTPAPRRNPMRARQLPTRFQDFVTYKPTHPISNYVTYRRVTQKHASYLSSISRYSEPQSFDDANSQGVWKKAMNEELQALDQHKTWTITKLPKGKKAVGCKWIYKFKFNSDGSIERHKARLVARGFTQTFDVDYKETFAPVAKMNSVRVLLSVAVNKGWSMYQMDVKNAFLHAHLKEEVYMKLPPRHPQSNEPDLVCKLHKSIYGLK